MNYQKLLSHLHDREPFSFSRWGDGEWNAILGTERKANTDGHTYFPDMGKALAEVLKSKPRYQLGMQNMAMRQRREEITKFLAENNIELNWCNADILHHASIRGELHKFFEAIKGKKVIIVGPGYLRKIEGKIKYSAHIGIPKKDCWLKREKISEQLKQILSTEKDCIVLFCASMMANVLIHEFYTDNHTLLDIGSLLDPYCGVHSRTYHKKLKL